jgi:hypothetical protein
LLAAEIEGEEVACWDAIHLVDVEKKEGEGGYAYQLCTTLILTAAASMAAYGKGKFAIDGTIYRTASQTCPLGEGHITNIGRLIEKTESNIRNMLGEVRRMQYMLSLSLPPSLPAPPNFHEERQLTSDVCVCVTVGLPFCRFTLARRGMCCTC